MEGWIELNKLGRWIEVWVNGLLGTRMDGERWNSWISGGINGRLERVNRTGGWICEWMHCWQIDRWIDRRQDREVLQSRLGMEGNNALHCPHLKVTIFEELNEVNIRWIMEKQESSRKTSISALLTMPKPLTVWITINCGKF